MMEGDQRDVRDGSAKGISGQALECREMVLSSMYVAAKLV